MALVLIFISLSVFTDGDMVEAAVGTMLENEGRMGAEAGARGLPTSAGAGGHIGSAEGTICEAPGTGTANGEETSAAPGPDGIEGAAQRLAARYQLTPREAETLPYLLRGRSLPRIQEELCISKGTANTHLRHIYQKMGVHTRQELIDAIGGEGSEGRA